MSCLKPKVEYFYSWFEKAGGMAYQYRWLVLIVCLMVLATSVFFTTRVRFDNSFNAYFDKQDPTYLKFLDFREEFGSDETSYILYHATGFEHGIWNIEVMQKIAGLTEALEKEVPFVKKIISLANAELIEGKNEELLVHRIQDNLKNNQAQLLELKDKILEKPMYVNSLVSKDSKHGALILEMEKTSVDPIEKIRLDPERGNRLDNLYPQATTDKIGEILARPEYRNITFFHSGEVPLNASYNRISQRESIRLGIISLIIIGLVLLFFFKTFLGAAAPLFLVFCSIIIAIGFMGIFSWNFDLLIILLPSLLVAVGVADAVHILSEYNILINKLGDKKNAVKRTLFLVGVPCFFTSLTTMAGFASMAVSPIKAVKHFAIYSSLGVGAAFVLSITLLIVFLSFGHRNFVVKEKKDRRYWNLVFNRISSFDIKYKKGILVFYTALFLVSAIGIFRLKVDSCIVTEFSKNSEIRKTIEYVDRTMGGSCSLNYVFDSGKQDGITSPQILKEIESLQQEAEKKEIVMKVYSIVDLIKDINKTLHNGDPLYYRIPDTKEEAAQLLFVYEMSGGGELDAFLSEDFSRTRLVMRCQAVGAVRYEKLVKELDSYMMSRNKPEVLLPSVAGITTIWLKVLEYIIRSQIIGFAVAFSVITVMMCFVLGSVRVGLISMIPNIWPIVITLGFMGWSGITLDFVKLLIACIAIGISVDDTIHIVTRYRFEFNKRGNYQDALFYSMRGVGRACSITSVVLMAGFLVNVFSEMLTFINFGILVALTIAMALAADLFLFPSLLLILKPFGPEKNA